MNSSINSLNNDFIKKKYCPIDRSLVKNSSQTVITWKKNPDKLNIHTLRACVKIFIMQN